MNDISPEVELLRNRREKSTVPLAAKEVTQNITSLTERVEKTEGKMKSYRRILFGTLGLAVLALASAGSVLLTSSQTPSSSEMKSLLEDNLKKPIEHLEEVLNRLDRKLDSELSKKR